MAVIAMTIATAAPASATSYSVRESSFPFGVVPVSGLNEVAAVSAGGVCFSDYPELDCPTNFSLALLSNGTVMAWGSNEQGELGTGGTAGSEIPVPVKGLSGVTAIAAGWDHSLALLSNGTVKAWGNNEAGELGTGGTTGSDVPVTVSGLSGVTAVAAGDRDSFALLSNGTVMAWGSNEFGKLGTGESSDVPVAVKGVSGVTAIAAGEYFAVALLSNGKVVDWGYGANGELGDLSELSGVTAISSGNYHTLALLSNGNVMAWGNNGAGQLGAGPLYKGRGPVMVSELSGAVAVAGGPYDSLALLSDGSVLGWGFGHDLPSALSAFSGAKGIAAGGVHRLAYGPFATVASVTPSAGPTAGGTPVGISGTDLGGATAVTFGSTNAASFTVNSETSITAVSPAQTAGAVDVTVTTPVDTSLPVSADRFSYVPPPVVGKVSPTNGSVVGGTAVTITGKNLTGTTAVNFGSTSAASFTVKSATSITAVSPAETEGRVDVTVTTTSGGTSAVSSKDRFLFVPTVTNVSPNTGSKAGGTSVTITGTGFALGKTATKVKFGTTVSKSVNCTSTTECTLVSPAHAVGTVDVKATVNNKLSSPKNAPADQFTYN